MPIQIDSVLNGKMDPKSFLKERLRGDIEFSDKMFMVRGASGELPQWIKVLADEWTSILKVGAMAFFTAFAAKAGGYTWDKRLDVVDSAIGITESVLYKLCFGLYDILLQCGMETRIFVGIAYPDDHFGTTIQISPKDIREIVVYLCLLHRDLDLIQETAREIRIKNESLLAGISVEYVDWTTIAFKYFALIKGEMQHFELKKVIS